MDTTLDPSKIQLLPCPKCYTEIPVELETVFCLNWQFGTGLKIFVENYSDWSVFGEIFAEQCYGSLLPEFRKNQPKLTIVDLGSNAGYFSFWAIQQCLLNGKTFTIQAVEANTQLCDITKTRMQKQTYTLPTGCSFKLFNNLIGKKSGFEEFVSADFHAMSSVRDVSGKVLQKTRMEYADLDKMLDPGVIDILKCDIEGSEFDFVEEYKDTLLKRVNTIIMEVHHLAGSPQSIDEKLIQIGFQVARHAGKDVDKGVYLWQR